MIYEFLWILDLIFTYLLLFRPYYTNYQNMFVQCILKYISFRVTVFFALLIPIPHQLANYTYSSSPITTYQRSGVGLAEGCIPPSV